MSAKMQQRQARSNAKAKTVTCSSWSDEKRAFFFAGS